MAELLQGEEGGLEGLLAKVLGQLLAIKMHHQGEVALLCLRGKEGEGDTADGIPVPDLRALAMAQTDVELIQVCTAGHKNS